MFEKAIISLLGGAFICETSSPEVFRWIGEGSAFNDLDEYLSRMGRKLSKTPGGQAYYATWIRVGGDERAEVKRVFSGIKQTIRPLIQFITLCMEIGNEDHVFDAGDRLEYAVILKAVTEKQHLQEKLRIFGLMGKEFAVSDSSAKAMLDRVFKQIEALGYIIQVNKEQELYRFTGKMDYFTQVIEFLRDHEKTASLDEQESELHEQGDLL